MKNQLKKIVLLVIVLLTASHISAYDFEVDGFCYNVVSISDLTAEIAQGEYSSFESICIPAEVTFMGRTFTIVKIGCSAFSNCRKLTSITIPSNIYEIGSYAFAGCTNLVSITTPEIVGYIEARAFDGCTSLDSVTIHSKNLISLNSDVNNYVFSNCKNVEYIHISSNVESIDNYIFNFNDKLKEVIIDDSENPLALGSNGFYVRNSWYCFGSELLEKIYWGRDLNSGYDLFVFDNVKEIYVGDLVTSTIGSRLHNYGALEKITIGKGLPEVPKLSGYSHLTSLILNSEVPQKANGFSNAQYLYLNVYVPKGSLAAYQSADVWKNFWNLQEMETTDINNVCFSSNDQSVKESKYFDATGREINSVHKGLNIIKMSDGTTRKVIIK